MNNLINENQLIDDQGEVRELQEEDFALGKSINDFPELKMLSKQMGRPKMMITKVSTTMRFDADTIAYFKAQGRGWQTRMNNVLTEYVRSHS